MDNIHDTPATATANYALNGKIMLGSVVVLFGVVSAVIFFHAYARCCSDRRRNRLPNFHRHVVLNGTRQPTGVNVADALRAANRARQFAGLDPSLLKTLPTFVYGGAAAAAPPPECAVCLSEFEDGERGRSLPACGHAFHAACIDAWFGSHSSCPLCRSPVKPTEPAAPGSSADSHVEIAVSEPIGVSEPTQDRDRVEPGSGFRAEWSDRKPQDLASLALRDDQITGSGLSSTERNRVKYSLKRIWSI